MNVQLGPTVGSDEDVVRTRDRSAELSHHPPFEVHVDPDPLGWWDGDPCEEVLNGDADGTLDSSGRESQAALDREPDCAACTCRARPGKLPAEVAAQQEVTLRRIPAAAQGGPGGHMNRVMAGGVLGALVMLGWLVVADGVFGLRRSVDTDQLEDERAVYEFLVEHVRVPGRYVANPAVVPEQGFPGDAPIFAVHYTGLGHADAGREMLGSLIVLLLASFLGAWLLANSSQSVRSRYGWRVAFFGAVGLVAALLGFGTRFGLAAYSMTDALALAAHDCAAWVLAGLVVALVVRPVEGMDAGRSN